MVSKHTKELVCDLNRNGIFEAMMKQGIEKNRWFVTTATTVTSPGENGQNVKR